MQDSKDLNWGERIGEDTDTEVAENGEQVANSDDARETDGWQQYRRWISKAPAPNRRRSGVDPSLYTWKGYRDWTEQVKRNWSDS